MGAVTPNPPTSGATAASNESLKSPKPARLSRSQQLNQLYALPAPLRTFPLPAFVPHNPLSLFHILYAWVSQAINPPSSTLEPLYQGWFSAATRSVHVTDVRSMRGLWEQGFYGKGNLSRSEPNWLNREKLRRGTQSKVTSEEITRRRRAERQQVKWERARKEREAIELKLLEEEEAALQAMGVTPRLLPAAAMVMKSSSIVLNDVHESLIVSKPKISSYPVGPLELLSLPNSAADLLSDPEGAHGSSNDNQVLSSDQTSDLVKHPAIRKAYAPPVGPLEILALPNSIEASLLMDTDLIDESIETLVADVVMDGREKNANLSEPKSVIDIMLNSNGSADVNGPAANGYLKTEDRVNLDNNDDGGAIVNGSQNVGTTTSLNGTANGSLFANGHSLSPSIKQQKSVRFSPTVEQNTFIQSEPPSPEQTAESPDTEEEPSPIKEQEHTQLTLEEAFFLSYALGALSVLDPATGLTLSNQKLFSLFRQTSHFPPLSSPSISPDDPFMVNYVVYHHFRSIGWVPRSGIKFSVDYLLYNRGPVFSHAEFGVIVLPSYSDAYWSSNSSLQKYAEEKQRRTWAWMSCINRVITQVKKTLVLVYVDIPKPLTTEEETELGLDGILGRYRIREFVMKRWLANRSRD